MPKDEFLLPLFGEAFFILLSSPHRPILPALPEGREIGNNLNLAAKAKI